MLDELKYQISEHKADYIYFNSETFFARKEQELKLFAAEYAEKQDCHFGVKQELKQ